MIVPSIVINAVARSRADLAVHHKTLDLLEGNLEEYVLESLKRQLSPRVFQYAKERVVPINIMPRYVEKLTNIYQTGVVREVQGGSQSDQDLLSWYQKELDINERMHIGNRLFNACKSALIHPYITGDEPKIRVIQNDRFVVCSDDPVDPTRPTMVILLAGVDDRNREIYWVYTAEDFAVVLSDNSIDYRAMEEMERGDGINPYGVLPFVYVNSSALRLNPVPDLDTIRMTEFVPMALTDLNLAAMFSAFSITYITNGSVQNLTYAPNAMWLLKSDDPEKDVTLGTHKPEVDYQEVLNLIQSELSLWLGSKGIKSGSVGQLTQENYASGIAKIIDEADTYDVRQMQTVAFAKAEHELWELILRDMHPVWVQQGLVENRTILSSTAEVDVKFSIVPVGTQRAQLISDQKEEYAAGFTTRKRAIAALNPQMTMEQVDQLIADIKEERTLGTEDSNGDQMAAGESGTAGAADQGAAEDSSGPDSGADS